jgi:aspartokinase-like uncharacterized kinase
VSETRPLVVKVGGGLLRDEGLDGLRRACAEVNEIATRQPVLVVPGGGPFADSVRASDKQIGYPDEVAHVLAMRAMDQLGVLLVPLLPDAELLEDLIAPEGLSVLAVAPAFTDRPGVPQTWAVTGDSLAVLAAGAIGAEEAVLLKPVAGVLPHWPSDDPPLAELTVHELEAMQQAGEAQVVDPYLPEAMRKTGVTVVVRAPRGVGTRITGG